MGLAKTFSMHSNADPRVIEYKCLFDERTTRHPDDWRRFAAEQWIPSGYLPTVTEEAKHEGDKVMFYTKDHHGLGRPKNKTDWGKVNTSMFRNDLKELNVHDSNGLLRDTAPRPMARDSSLWSGMPLSR